MNFKERKIKDLNLEVFGARVSDNKAKIKPSNCLPEADRGWKKYCQF